MKDPSNQSLGYAKYDRNAVTYNEMDLGVIPILVSRRYEIKRSKNS